MFKHPWVLVRSRPMVGIALAFITGIILGSQHVVGIVHVSVLLLLLLAGSIAFRYLRNPLVWFCLLVLAGTLRISFHAHHPPGSLKHFEPAADSVYTVSGVVLEKGLTRRGNLKFIIQPFQISDQSILKGRLILYMGRDSTEIAVSDTLVFLAGISEPRPKRNPYAFDYRKYLETQDIYLEGYLDQGGVLQVREGNDLRVVRTLNSLREKAMNHLQRYLSERSAGVLAALTLGERSEVDQQTREDFANTGVIHVLAVSGLHVGYVSLILMSVIGLLRIPRTIQIFLVISGLIFYVLLTGSAPSVMRASLMASLILISVILERRSDIYNTLGTAAFVILLIDPGQLNSIGFQLSFSAVLSIVSLFPVLKAKIPVVRLKKYPKAAKFLHAIVDLFLVSLAAQLGTLAFTILYFQKVPIISLLANMVVVPAIGLIVATGLAFLTLGVIVPLFAIWWGALLETLIQLILEFVAFCASFSWAFAATRVISPLETILILAAVFTLLVHKWQRRVKLLLILCLLFLNQLVWQRVVENTGIEIVMLDIGQGDAVVIHSSNDATIVIDAGMRFGGRDMGAEVISPYLRGSGHSIIDMLVLTHPHNDHIGGAQYLIENHTVKKVIMQDVHYDSYTYEKLKYTLDSLAIPVQSARMGEIDTTLAPLYLRMMGPAEFDSSSQPSNVNDVSVVIQLFYGNTSILLTGDAEHHVERDQLMFGDLLKSDMIKVPHHGSKTSSTRQYLDLVQPTVGLISLGKRNKYKHPDPNTVRTYEELGTRLHRTDLEGAIIYHSDGARWEYVDWRNDQN